MRLLLLLLFFPLIVCSQQISLNEVRGLYKEASENTDKLVQLEEKVEVIEKNNSNKILVAYKGGTIALRASKAKKIKDKKELLLEAISFIEHSIEKKPKNIENRFIRLSVQENLPKFIAYRKNIEEDKNYILDNYSSLKSKSLKKHIKDFVFQSKSFKEEEKKEFR